MKAAVFVLVSGVLMLGGTLSSPDATDDDQKKIQGAWELDYLQTMAKKKAKIAKDDPDYLLRTFMQPKVRDQTKDTVKNGTYTLDASNPDKKLIDIFWEKETEYGIYQFEGDYLVISSRTVTGDLKKSRPTDFKVRTAQDRLMRFKRPESADKK
jgi:uncharacterized protein (TIGR03067 family)